MLDNQTEYCITQLIESKNRQIEVNEQLFKRLDALEKQMRDSYEMISELRWQSNAISNHLHMNKPTSACCALHAGSTEECK